MTKVEEQLLALLRLAIHPEEHLPEVLLESSIDWASICTESKRQSVIGIAYVGFNVWLNSPERNVKTGMPERRMFLTWHGLAESVTKRNMLLNEQSQFVCDCFLKEGFRSTIMKGQGNAYLYGEELGQYRLPGDIDVWVEGGFEKVNGYVQRVRPTREVNELEIHFSIMKKTDVEVHYRPCIIRNPFKNKRLQDFFQRQANACYSNMVVLKGCSRGTCITNVPFNLVQQLVHIHLHLFTEGIGLRQLMDYYFQLLRAKEKNEDVDEVRCVVASLGLERFAKALCWILHSYLALPLECCLWTPNEKDGRFLLAEILRTGNFGHYDIENQERKQKQGYGFWKLFIRNLSLSRFDRSDWIWGPIWRIYHGIWKKIHGFK